MDGIVPKESSTTYGDMQLDDVRKRFHLIITRERLFERITPIEPSAWLTETLRKGLDLSLISEKARSEFLVAPILLAVRDVCEGKISIYSGIRFDVDPDDAILFVLSHNL